MNSPLQEIRGLTITTVKQIRDYVQIHFAETVGISIYTRMAINPSLSEISELTGKTVIEVLERKDEIVLIFLDDLTLKIDMRAEAYHGPEALELNRRGHPPVIWN